jgi:beta-lactamase regulating signal transducer with metallopeptidase domain
MVWWLFQNAVMTVALAGVVAAICRSGRLGPVVKHALWVLVLVKFVTPPIVVWPWTAPDPLRLAAFAAHDARAGVTPLDAIGRDAPAAADADAVHAASAGTVTSRDRRDGAGDRGIPWEALYAILIAGSLGMLAVQGVRLVRLGRHVRRSPQADAELRRRVSEMAIRMGLRRVPAVIEVARVSSPAIWGFGRPRLLWPAGISARSSDACVDGLLVHELAHLKRNDHLVGWIELAAGIVWWWNPLFWYVRGAMREQAELACDAWVVSALPDGRRAYAESLLALSGAAAQSTPAMAVIGIRASSRRVLERRLVMIMTGRAPLHLPVGGLLTLALAAAVTLPAWASGQPQAPPPPPTLPTPVVDTTPPAPPLPPAVEAPLLPRPVRADRQQPPPPAPPPTPARVLTRSLRTAHLKSGRLPADGQKLLQDFEAARDAIAREADRQVEARRAEIVKALEALQNEYATSGRLDEAVAIRDYLRAGGPGKLATYTFRKR